MRREFQEAGRGVEGNMVAGGGGARAAWPQPTWSSLPTVGASLPDATAFGSSPFGPQLWDH